MEAKRGKEALLAKKTEERGIKEKKGRRISCERGEGEMDGWHMRSFEGRLARSGPLSPSLLSGLPAIILDSLAIMMIQTHPIH